MYSSLLFEIFRSLIHINYDKWTNEYKGFQQLASLLVGLFVVCFFFLFSRSITNASNSFVRHYIDKCLKSPINVLSILITAEQKQPFNMHLSVVDVLGGLVLMNYNFCIQYQVACFCV